MKFKGLAWRLRFHHIGCLFIKPILEPISTLFSFRGVPLHDIEDFTKDWIQKQELGLHLGWRFIFKSVSLSWTNYFLYIRVQGAQKIHLGKHTRRKGLVLSGLPMSCCLRLNQEERRAFFYFWNKTGKTIIANNETLPLPWGRSANRDRGISSFLGFPHFITLDKRESKRTFTWVASPLEIYLVSFQFFLLEVLLHLVQFHLLGGLLQQVSFEVGIE